MIPKFDNYECVCVSLFLFLLSIYLFCPKDSSARPRAPAQINYLEFNYIEKASRLSALAFHAT